MKALAKRVDWLERVVALLKELRRCRYDCELRIARRKLDRACGERRSR